ncbi:MAG: dockerin type I repeat-containing protein [Phycisphaeraceae bacterium]|nr:dockerin type I repeat-containing protein [Phycisphaeraceae bacterium]
MALSFLLPGLRDMTRSAHADPPRYRITNLGVAPQSLELAESRSRALGLNRVGQVVGWCDVPIPVGELSVTRRRPVLWLPEPMWGLPAGELIVLLHADEITSESLFATEGEARAINAEGVVVGIVAGEESDPQQDPGVESHAFLWLPEEGPPFSPYDDLPVQAIFRFFEESASASFQDGAWGVADSIDGHFRVVGEKYVADGSPPVTCMRGFEWRSADRDRTALEPSGSDPWSQAYAINRQGTDDESARIGGGSGSTCPLVSTTACTAGQVALGYDPVLWRDDSSVFEPEVQPLLTQYASMDRDLRGHRIFGVNDDGVRTGGGGGWDEQEEVCLKVPLAWRPGISAVDELPIDELHEGVGRSVNRQWQIVGQDLTLERAVLWEEDLTSQTFEWIYNRLDDAQLNLVDMSACGWSALLNATGVSDHEGEGWIVGHGRFLEGIEERERAFLLVPILPCDADLNGDGTVTSADLALLQQAYGSCPVGEICWADLNGDCVVDNADRTIATSLLSLDCSGESLTEGFSQSSIPLEYIELWLALGGAEALISNEISTAAVVACLHHAEPAVGLVNLFALIGQSMEEVE